MKSIIQTNKECFICGKNGGYWGLDRHHVYGHHNRNNSEKFGLVVWLCHDECHLNGVHKDAELNRLVQAKAQKIAMEHYGWSIEDFRSHFGKIFIRG